MRNKDEKRTRRVSEVLDTFAAQPEGRTWLDMAEVAVDAVTRADHEAGARRWHKAYSRWFYHDMAGHRIRAVVWGWIADRIVRFA